MSKTTTPGPLPGPLPAFLQPRFLFALVAALTLAKLLAAWGAHFVEDEAYYRIWGLNPALSYYDHPPMIGWWIFLGQQVFGDTIFAARVLVVLSSAVGSLVLWRTAFVLFEARTAGWAVLFFNTSILVGVGGILATPDAPSVFFWGLSFWALAELQTSRNANWWLVVGLFAGLGLLSKYSVLFLGAGIVLWLLWVPEARRWFGRWQLWAGGLLAVALFSPVLYWNHLHDWASFAKQFGRAGSDGGYTLKYIFEFIGAVVGLLNPLIAVLAFMGAAKLAPRVWQRDATASLVLLTLLPFLLYLTYHSLHARVQGNWPAPLFPAMGLLAAVFVARLDERARIWRGLAIGGVVLGAVVACVVQLHAAIPLSGALGRKDPTHQLRGWPEIGRKIERIAAETGADYVLTSGYGLNAQIDFLLKDRLPVYQVNERIRYVMAPDPDPDSLTGTGLYVAEDRRDAHERFKEFFGSVELVAELPRTVRGERLEDIRVYELIRPSGMPLDPVGGTGPDGRD
ncbi:glycosyl transferase [Roseibium aquae]|uniref:Glycosyl transferase n=1 Tax=Roseibium aquae TaxID=1323746 RepID=A0A916TKR0_9HYPH|nr:glycosyltransferase family 39 protein [Roseibium aquae]GGB52751.1 glycosyl transferase [Roseibium aquae]